MISEPGALGDADADHVRMRCRKCGKLDHISAEFQHLSAKERMGIRVRRLAEIRMVRRVIWEDD